MAGIYLFDTSDQRRLHDIKRYMDNNFGIWNDLWSIHPARQNNSIYIKSDKLSEPDFFGDEYLIDNDMPQTGHLSQ